MFLKSLEVHGFKSFAEKTRFEFDSGITCIVGPNGCGKSNVADAVRWVLGEQSAKSLRGQKMEDVIFSGAESRKPLGMSEVSLVVNNKAGRFTKLPGLRELSEIRVTRRLYRSGESEYLLNNIVCRLKDISELMAGHSLTPQMLSLMEQGHVDAIINCKPSERRFIIEEVAGIGVFKHRKTVAVRKLEATEANLLRVQDILEEVRRRRNSLNRQAKKAERYRRIQQEMRQLDQGLLAHDYARLRDELREVERAYYDSKGREAHLAKRLSEGDRLSVDQRQVMDALECASRELGERVHIVERAADASEHERKTMHEQVAEQRRIVQELRLDMKRLDGEIVSFDADIEGRHAAIEQHATALTSKEEQLRLQQQSSRDLSVQLRTAGQELEERTRQLMNLLGEIAELRNQCTSFETQVTLLDRRREKLSAERTAEEERQTALQGELTAAHGALEEFKQEIERRRSLRNAAHQQLAAHDRDLEELTDQCRGMEETLLAARTQCATLEDMAASRHDFNSGVQAIFARSASTQAASKGAESADADVVAPGDGESQRRGLLGVVADFIEAPEEFELAIEAVLGDRLQSIIAEDTSAALTAIEYLKRGATGRSAFIPKDLLAYRLSPPPNNSAPTAMAGTVGPALSFVRCKEELLPVVTFLLGRVMIVEDLDCAVHCWRSNGAGVTYVTREGEIVDESGIVVGGRQGAENLGILARKRQLQELQQVITSNEDILRTLQTQRQAKTAQRQNARAAAERLDAEMRCLEVEAVNRQRDIDGHRSELARLAEHLELITCEAQQLADERSGLIRSLAEQQATLAAQQARRRERETEINQFERQLEQLATQQDERNAEMHASQDILGDDRAALNRLQMELTRLRERRSHLQEQVSALQRRVRDAEQKIIKLNQSLETVSLKLHEQLAERTALQQQLVEENERLDGARAELEHLDRRRRDTQSELDTVREGVNAHALKRTELQVQAQHRAQRCIDEYRCSIEEIQRQARLDEEVVAGAPERLAELRDKLQALGDVNLGALQEFEELDERYTFMQKQYNDLQQSVQGLHRAIQKINQTTRERFLTAFEQVRAQFHEVYATISNGGRADLQLCDLEDIWETGLEIVAQPPGKRLQSISLLSAGEKAMAAIALLVAVFLVRPAPFCIMDEVDAPLDENNISRFLDLVSKLTQRTQFLVVTHSRRTMNYANVLYGVTMEEQGVSKVVSVNFAVDTDVAPHDAVPV